MPNNEVCSGGLQQKVAGENSRLDLGIGRGDYWGTKTFDELKALTSFPLSYLCLCFLLCVQLVVPSYMFCYFYFSSGWFLYHHYCHLLLLLLLFFLLFLLFLLLFFLLLLYPFSSSSSSNHCQQQQQLQAQHLSHGHGPPVPLTPHPSGLQPPGIPPLGGSASLLALSSALSGQSHLAIKDDKKHHDAERHRGERPGKPD